MMKSKFLPRLPCSPDETHVSWAGRLAALHSGGGLNPFLADLNIPRNAFHYGYPDFVLQLCQIADQDPEPVLKNTILRAKTGHYKMGDKNFRSVMLMERLTKFCPKCLMEDDPGGNRPHSNRRERLAWRFSSVHVCPIHHVFLMPDNVFSPARQDFSERIPLCYQNLRLLSDSTKASTPSPLQSYLLNRIAGGRGPDWLDGHTIDQAVCGTEMLGAVLEFGCRADIQNMSIKDWHLAACTGWKYTSQGTSDLRTAFNAIQSNGPKVTRRRDINPGYRFGIFHHWMVLRSAQNDAGPMRDVLLEHILATEPITTARKVLGVRVRRNNIPLPRLDGQETTP